MVTQPTPIEALYTETGLLDITTIITTKNRLNMGKILHTHPYNMINQNNGNKHRTEGGWKETTTRIREHINETLHNTKLEGSGTTKIHKRIDENGSIHHLQSENKNAGREEQLQREIQGY